MITAEELVIHLESLGAASYDDSVLGRTWRFDTMHTYAHVRTRATSNGWYIRIVEECGDDPPQVCHISDTSNEGWTKESLFDKITELYDKFLLEQL